MDDTLRKPFQGIRNIIRFNWHFYVASCALVGVLLMVSNLLPEDLQYTSRVILIMVVVAILSSLLVSFYVYDISDLYALSWLDDPDVRPDYKMVNINAGFDEISNLLSAKYPANDLIVYDFYDPDKHTEISIERARKAYPGFPGTIKVESSHIPLGPESVDLVFIIFSAHEIRSRKERITFFKELKRILKSDGKIIMLEHLRDVPNFFAYTIGFFHFFSRREWLETFYASNLTISQEFSVTPFVRAFKLNKNGNTP